MLDLLVRLVLLTLLNLPSPAAPALLALEVGLLNLVEHIGQLPHLPNILLQISLVVQHIENELLVLQADVRLLGLPVHIHA